MVATAEEEGSTETAIRAAALGAITTDHVKGTTVTADHLLDAAHAHRPVMIRTENHAAEVLVS